MNNNITIDSLWPMGIFAAAIICIILARRLPRRRIAFTFLTALLSVIGMVGAFVAVTTLEELLISFLILLWLSLCSMDMEGDEK